MTRGWTKQEKNELLKCVRLSFKNKTPVKNAFAEFAAKHNRKPDSVRNFYYSMLSTADYIPEGITKNDVVVFSLKETTQLISKIMQLCANGNSVRGAIAKITGDKKKMLRYQNKYRNLVRAKSPIIYDVMEKQKKSLRYFDPFTKRVVEIERTPVKTLVKDKKLPLYKETISTFFDSEIEEANVADLTIKRKSEKAN